MLLSTAALLNDYMRVIVRSSRSRPPTYRAGDAKQRRERRREKEWLAIRKACASGSQVFAHQSFIGHWLWDIVDDWLRRRYLISAYHTCFAVPYLPRCASLSHRRARSRFLLPVTRVRFHARSRLSALLSPPPPPPLSLSLSHSLILSMTSQI